MHMRFSYRVDIAVIPTQEMNIGKVNDHDLTKTSNWRQIATFMGIVVSKMC